ncbi:MAG: NifB/NifX family molybdenum-iron cluster-binding protein [Candidatus Margulisbacteria bacterium]|nr:NifB/NifX family molybdenum-iron cluster-binding protein [Candidatus Margulisiibacteriota bacterium]MBU1616310.1 NifB/NifX family molybdenum-iron cluster-binding protein [Candidatus Margulisiibacteriota bacterium]
MKVGIVLEDEQGLKGDVCPHFGQCKYFFLVDIDKENKKIINTCIVPNAAQHGGGGCVAVDEILKHKVTHVIAGGMGMGAQQKFAGAGVEVFGFSGNVEAALDEFMNNTLGGLSACREHGAHGECH